MDGGMDDRWREEVRNDRGMDVRWRKGGRDG